MAKKLLIVESPAKAKTIEKFLGSDFSVKSSYGHIRDLEKSNDLGVDVNNHFEPNYVIPVDKFKVVKELKDSAGKVDEVWLATDEDREGEAISWHICQVLGLDVQQTKRIVFHEITKPAIQKAVQMPRSVDMNVVNAQQARRVLDRLVGWELSGILWKKVKGSLSAGRVQSVAVKLIVEREREILNFNSTAYFRITAQFSAPNAANKMVAFQAESPVRFESAADAEQFLKKCIGADYPVQNIDVRPTRRKPAPPFITSTLQQEASRKLGFSVSRTMSVAQRLYEQGFITYMRTDSTNLSDFALQAIGDEILKQFGPKYHHRRQYKTNKENAQEAHESIRPTYADKMQVSENREEQRLYELIWKRAVASQMADAELEKTVVDLGISTQPGAKLVAEGEVLKFDGFLKLYLESTDDEEEESQGILPPLKIGQKPDLDFMTGTEKFTRAPARFSEAGLVKKMEELGIGRPSTYAPTISKIMEANRGYVVKDSRPGEERHYRVMVLKDGKIESKTNKEITGTTKNLLYPTDIGMIVCGFLDQHFDKIMDYGFTAGIEKKFDDIADGKLVWNKMIENFYGPFHETVLNTIKVADRADGERILGIDPESGRTILVRLSSLGKPVVQIGKSDELGEKEKPKYANLKPGATMESVTLEEALGSFALPRSLGSYKDLEVTVNSGRFGPYVKFGDAFVSLPKGEDPFEISFEKAVELIDAKQKADAPIGYYESQPITKGKGRFGPFVKWTDLYINVPKAINFDTITEQQAVELVLSKIEKEANRYVQIWPEEQISIENGRFGPYIRFGKNMISLPKIDGAKVTTDQARSMTLEDVKKRILEEIPTAFDKKTKAKKK